MKGFLHLIIAWTMALPFWLSFSGSTCAEESWGASLFKVKRHDFGRVAIGADAEYRFEFQNEYVEDLRILGANSSCGCTAVSVTTDVLRSEQTGAVIAKLNTSGQHTREKSATLSVVLETIVDGRVLRDTVQLFVTSYIRPDVVLTPGIVEFGSVPEGHAVVRTLTLEYAGRDDWALTKISRNNLFVHAKAEEIKRNRGEIAYRITVTLKDNAPIGYVKDALRFTTNERRPGMNEPMEIVLPLQGVVTAPIHAKPSPFLVGLVAPGESVSKSMVVQSDTPFRILSVESEDKRYRFTFADQESNIQLISVLFSAKTTQTDEPVNLADTIRIRTNLPDQEYVTVHARARLEPRTETNGLPLENSLEISKKVLSANEEAWTRDSGFVAVDPSFEAVYDPVADPPVSEAKSAVAGKARFGTPSVPRGAVPVARSF